MVRGVSHGKRVGHGKRGGSWCESVCPHNAVVGCGDLPQLPLCQVDGLKEVSQALVASKVQLSWVHL